MLIITADDYGKNQQTTDNILKCYLNNRITSASAMVFMLDSERAASSSSDIGLEIGLHLNFTLPFTASNAPPKLREQQNKLISYLTKHKLSSLYFNPLLTDAFRFVFLSQKEEFMRLYSKLPCYYNGHHHMHLCSNMLLGRRLPKGARVRRSFSFERGEKGAFNRVYRQTLNLYISKRFISTNDFFSIEPIEDHERLENIIKRAFKDDVEIEVHPEKVEEIEYLLSDHFLTLIRSVVIGRFSRLPSNKRDPTHAASLKRAEDARNTYDDKQGEREHIGVCLCTYKRPQLLSSLLERLEQQETGGLFGFSLHIVDNDAMKSAEKTVASFAQRAKIPVTYYNEPIQNIALARNRAVRAAEGTLIAFLDDDEMPGDEWLVQLYLSLKRYHVAGVLGPVRPFFPPEAPVWLIKSRLCERPSHISGKVLTYAQTRTGNVLFDRRIIRTTDTPFPPEMGRTGGEDIEFFRTMMARGHTFIWCEEAPLYEIVLPERLKRKYHIQKALRIGGLSGEMLGNLSGFGRWKALFRSAYAAAGYGFLSLPSILLGQHIFMRYITKTVYYSAQMAGWFGHVPIRER